MLILLSPAKTLNFAPLISKLDFTLPQARPEIVTLVSALKKYNSSQLGKLLSLSKKLAELNYQRYQAFNTKHFNLQNAKAAIYAFQGDVYRHLAVQELDTKQISYMQDHLLILSGLYGYLRPLDLIQAYRLEMSSRISIGTNKNLYEFWGDKITHGINQQVINSGNEVIINLASEEYFKAVNTKQLLVPVLTIQFKEKRGDNYQVIGLNAKRARGMMARYIILHQIKNIGELKKVVVGNYCFADKLSSNHCFCFVR